MAPTVPVQKAAKIFNNSLLMERNHQNNPITQNTDQPSTSLYISTAETDLNLNSKHPPCQPSLTVPIDSYNFYFEVLGQVCSVICSQKKKIHNDLNRSRTSNILLSCNSFLTDPSIDVIRGVAIK